MHAKLLWTPQAREDLLEIYRLIGLEQPAAAERIFDRIEGKAQRLADYPRMGMLRADIRPAVRMLVEGPYLLLYEIWPDSDEGRIESVEIVRIIDGRRDLKNVF